MIGLSANPIAAEFAAENPLTIGLTFLCGQVAGEEFVNLKRRFRNFKASCQWRIETMQYLLLIYENEQRFSKGYEESEMNEYQAFGKEFAKNIKGGNALQPTGTAKTVRMRNGKSSRTDGPFAETKEQLGGFYLVEAKDIGEAAKMAEKIPGARFGSVEVRPIMQFS